MARLRVDKALRRLELDHHSGRAALAVWLELGKRVLGQVVDAAPRARAVVGAAGAGGAGAAVAADLVLVVRPAAAAVLDERLAGDQRRCGRRRRWQARQLAVALGQAGGGHKREIRGR